MSPKMGAVQPVAVATEAGEHALVARVRAGDVGAFETLFRTYYTPLWRFAIGQVGSAEAARDIVQDLFAALWERRAGWVVERSVATYLYGAVRNRALNDLRRARVANKWAEQAAANLADIAVINHPALLPDEAVAQSETMAQVRQAVAALPERQRQALVLRWYHGLSQQEIAGVLGISTKAVESLMSRGMATLRASLRGA